MFRALRVVFLASAGLLSALCAQIARADSDIIASGSGFFINSEGWLVTNAHVLESCEKATVPQLGEVTGWIVDKINDLAVGRVTEAVGKSHLLLRRGSPRLGEDVATLGYPFATLLSASIKITTGNVNSLVGMHDDTRYLQISTPIQPGNSGGPVVDKNGSLVGVATATLGLGAAIEAGALPQNVNFAINAEVLQIFLRSRGIAFTLTDDPGKDISTADMAAIVAPAIVQVLCHGNSAGAETANNTPAVAQPTAPQPSPPSSETLAAKFASEYQAVWSKENSSALAALNLIYANPVSFYGKTVTAASVLDEKRKFAARWPMRSYSIRPGTISTTCIASVCEVSAVIDWFARSKQRRKAASGVASFYLRIDVLRNLVLGETGKVIKGLKPDVSPLLNRWGELNSACRGGSGDEQSTMDACDMRNEVDANLAAANWCYGREGEYGYQMQWHECD